MKTVRNLWDLIPRHNPLNIRTLHPRGSPSNAGPSPLHIHQIPPSSSHFSFLLNIRCPPPYLRIPRTLWGAPLLLPSPNPRAALRRSSHHNILAALSPHLPRCGRCLCHRTDCTRERRRIPDANTQVENYDRLDIDCVPVDFLPRAMASRFPGELPDTLPHNRLFFLLSSLTEEDIT